MNNKYDMTRNGQAYVESSMAHHVACQLSTERRFPLDPNMSSSKVMLEEALCTLFSIREPVNQHHATQTPTITKTCTRQKRAYHENVLHASLSNASYSYKDMRLAKACLP